MCYSQKYYCAKGHQWSGVKYDVIIPGSCPNQGNPAGKLGLLPKELSRDSCPSCKRKKDRDAVNSIKYYYKKMALEITEKNEWDSQKDKDDFVAEWTKQAVANRKSREAANPKEKNKTPQITQDDYKEILKNTKAKFGVDRLPKDFNGHRIDKRLLPPKNPRNLLLRDPISSGIQHLAGESSSSAMQRGTRGPHPAGQSTNVGGRVRADINPNNYPVSYVYKAGHNDPGGSGIEDMSSSSSSKSQPPSNSKTGNVSYKGKGKAPVWGPTQEEVEREERMNREDFSIYRWPAGYDDDSDHDDLYANPSSRGQSPALAAGGSSPPVAGVSSASRGTGSQARSRATSKASSKGSEESWMKLLNLSPSPPATGNVGHQKSNSPAQKQKTGKAPASGLSKVLSSPAVGRGVQRQPPQPQTASPRQKTPLGALQPGSSPATTHSSSPAAATPHLRPQPLHAQHTGSPSSSEQTATGRPAAGHVTAGSISGTAAGRRTDGTSSSSKSKDDKTKKVVKRK